MSRTAVTNRFKSRDFGTALKFGANTSDQVAIENSAGQVWSGDTDFSVSLWCKPTAFGDYYAFAIPDAAGANRTYITINSAGSLLTNVGAVGSTTTGFFKRGVWTHVVLVKDRTNELYTVYGDGVEIVAPTAYTPGTAANIDIFIGQQSAAGAKAWNGLITQCFFWNRALTADEVSALYYQGTIPHTASLLGKYRLNEGSGTTATDSSGNGNHGTITGATYTSDVPSYERKSINANLVKNGDFEFAPPFTAETTAAARWIDGTAAGSTTNDLFGWATVSGAVTASAAASFDTTVSYAGSNSIKLSTLNTSGAIAVANTTATAAPPTTTGLYILSPSTSYTLTVKCKTSNVASNGAYAFIRQYTGALATVATTNTDKLSGTNDWTTLSATVTTGASTRYASIALLNNVAGNVSDAWFDDISLTPTTPITRTAATGRVSV